MKIYANVRSISGRTTGVQRYGREILSRIENIIIVGEGKDSGITGHLWEQTVLPKLTSDGLLWSPANTGPITVQNQVVTIHDVAALDHPEWFSSKFSAWYNFVLPRVAKKAKKIITVSEFSKSRIVEKCRVNPEKIYVTPLGVSERFGSSEFVASEEVLKKFGLSAGEYYLFVSSLEPRKNMARILEAWTTWEDRPDNIKLAFIGDTVDIFNNVNLTDDDDSIIFTGRVSDSELYSIYQNACAFLYVSLYEGFGLPVLESMAAGVPVIASNTTSIPEAAGNAALLVDPLSTHEISNAMKRIFEDVNLRKQLIDMGSKHVKMFSWQSTAQKTYDVIKSLDKS